MHPSYRIIHLIPPTLVILVTKVTIAMPVILIIPATPAISVIVVITVTLVILIDISYEP